MRSVNKRYIQVIYTSSLHPEADGRNGVEPVIRVSLVLPCLLEFGVSVDGHLFSCLSKISGTSSAMLFATRILSSGSKEIHRRAE